MFALSFPGTDALATIYSSILSQHLQQQNIAQPLKKISTNLVQGALMLHQRITSTFLPTAIKFHYVFNLRDLSNIFQVNRKEEILNLFMYLRHGYNLVIYFLIKISIFYPVRVDPNQQYIYQTSSKKS